MFVRFLVVSRNTHGPRLNVLHELFYQLLEDLQKNYSPKKNRFETMRKDFNCINKENQIPEQNLLAFCSYNKNFWFCNNKSEFWIPVKTSESNSSQTIGVNQIVPDSIIYTHSKNGYPIRAHEAKIEVQSFGGNLKFRFVVANFEILGIHEKLKNPNFQSTQSVVLQALYLVSILK